MVTGEWSDLPLVLTTDQAAAVLQVNRRTVASMLDRGDLAGVKVGKEWRVSRADLRRFIERRASSGSHQFALRHRVARLIKKGNVIVAQVGRVDEDLTDIVRREREGRVDELLKRSGL